MNADVVARTREWHAERAEMVLDAWNRQDVAAVVACYTEDLQYRDPNTRGVIQGREAFARYLTRLFDGWQMHWALREDPYTLSDVHGSSVLWRATLQKKGGTDVVTIDGMDLALLDGELVKRNDVYYDRVPVLPLMT